MPWMDTTPDPEVQGELLIAQLTLDEIVSPVHLTASILKS